MKTVLIDLYVNLWLGPAFLQAEVLLVCHVLNDRPTADWSNHLDIFGKSFQQDGGQTNLQGETEHLIKRSGCSPEDAIY